MSQAQATQSTAVATQNQASFFNLHTAVATQNQASFFNLHIDGLGYLSNIREVTTANNGSVLRN